MTDGREKQFQKIETVLLERLITSAIDKFNFRVPQNLRNSSNTLLAYENRLQEQ
jgi:hypothetical protein